MRHVWPWLVQLRLTLVSNSSSGRSFLLAYRLLLKHNFVCPIASEYPLYSPFPTLSLEPYYSSIQLVPFLQYFIKVKV